MQAGDATLEREVRVLQAVPIAMFTRYGNAGEGLNGFPRGSLTCDADCCE